MGFCGGAQVLLIISGCARRLARCLAGRPLLAGRVPAECTLRGLAGGAEVEALLVGA